MNNFSDRDRLFEEYLRDGISAIKSGQRKLAISLLNRAIYLNGSDSRPYLWLSATTDNPGEQREYLEQAVSIDPTNIAARRGLAMLTGKIDRSRLMKQGAEIDRSQMETEVEVRGVSFLCPRCGGRMSFSTQGGLTSPVLVCEYCFCSLPAVTRVAEVSKEIKKVPVTELSQEEEHVQGAILPPEAAYDQESENVQVVGHSQEAAYGQESDLAESGHSQETVSAQEVDLTPEEVAPEPDLPPVTGLSLEEVVPEPDLPPVTGLSPQEAIQEPALTQTDKLSQEAVYGQESNHAQVIGLSLDEAAQGPDHDLETDPSQQAEYLQQAEYSQLAEYSQPAEYSQQAEYSRHVSSPVFNNQIADRAEQVLDFIMPTTRAHRWAEAQQLLVCELCGAMNVLPPGLKATRCSYCGANQFVESKEHLELVDPQVIALMKIEQKLAIKLARQWLRKGIFSPDNLLVASRGMQLRPAYYSCWTFDGTVEMHWSCEVVQGSGQFKQWMPLSGDESRFFNDVLVPGVKVLAERELDSLSPFDLIQVEEFKPEHLAGWTAILYDRSLADASLLAREKVIQKFRPQVFDMIALGREKRNVNVSGGDWSGMTFKHILLPLWIGSYRYKGKVYRLLVNGQTGKIAGDKPRDMVKLIFSLLIAIMFLALLGMILWFLFGNR